LASGTKSTVRENQQKHSHREEMEVTDLEQRPSNFAARETASEPRCATTDSETVPSGRSRAGHWRPRAAPRRAREHDDHLSRRCPVHLRCRRTSIAPAHCLIRLQQDLI
jgi:hypothetical protein